MQGVEVRRGERVGGEEPTPTAKLSEGVSPSLKSKRNLTERSFEHGPKC